MTDNNVYVLSPFPVAPVNEVDMVLLPDGLKALKRVAKRVGLVLGEASFNLDAGVDATHNRPCIFNAGMIPNIKENPRNRKSTKRRRKWLCHAAIHAARTWGAQTFAWEDKFTRRLLRFEHIQQRHFGMKLMTYTLTCAGIVVEVSGTDRVQVATPKRPPSGVAVWVYSLSRRLQQASTSATRPGSLPAGAV
jgi:hypothetical protein